MARPRAPGAPGRALSLRAALAAVGGRGVRTLLVEAGPRLTSSLLREGLADRLLLYLAPKFLGRGEGSGLFDGAAPTNAGGPAPPRAQPTPASARYARLGPDLLADFRLTDAAPTDPRVRPPPALTPTRGPPQCAIRAPG